MPVAEVGKVGSRGQITIPKKIREREGIEEGDYVVIIEEDERLTVEKLSLENWLKRVRKVEERRGEPAPEMETVTKETHEMREVE
ncbi:hypothetical protein AKJ57_00120 [candidate division MSBL1 archaeon SCGC-AAA259A05]|uniref:SpoVT-AbrB domain-containing protein n=1 Tax=candidate division MSBL1 archaeon SCGC-AAA259A05 TaxID=1698259 RepID=A0A133UC06_9EURY|nr:hypothetical protein AKJ57_00120 [candidate division MSBL1 archaeon SCGC-AAA259A05]